MAIIAAQCLNEKEELLFPQISFEQIITPEGEKFNDYWLNLKKEILHSIYPIGSILILESDSNPNILIPNTAWEKISQARILVGIGNLDGTQITDRSSVSTAYAVQITTSTLPSHNHKLNKRDVTMRTGGEGYDYCGAGSNAYTAYRGGGGYHTNIMPFICANIWTRTA